MSSLSRPGPWSSMPRRSISDGRETRVSDHHRHRGRQHLGLPANGHHEELALPAAFPGALPAARVQTHLADQFRDGRVPGLPRIWARRSRARRRRDRHAPARLEFAADRADHARRHRLRSLPDRVPGERASRKGQVHHGAARRAIRAKDGQPPSRTVGAEQRLRAGTGRLRLPSRLLGDASLQLA